MKSRDKPEKSTPKMVPKTSDEVAVLIGSGRTLTNAIKRAVKEARAEHRRSARR
ncbi:MAG: hypothetical protein K2X32_09410 [Phycisphaerales bacterium]|nr:hypothetical protein [Phycisphaerales bacterium]